MVRLPEGKRTKEGKDRRGRRESTKLCYSSLICNPCKVIPFVLSVSIDLISFKICSACHLSQLKGAKRGRGSQGPS